jgi:hypothetical protein
VDLTIRRFSTMAGSSLVLLLALGGCGTSTGTPTASGPTLAPYALTIDDRSSWGPLQILIGDTVVGQVGCSGATTVTPGDPGVPPLPWTVRLVNANGQTVDQRVEDGLAGPIWVLVFDAQVEEGSSRALGPIPQCVFPSPTIESLPTKGLTSAAAIDLASQRLAPRSATPIAIQSATIGRLATYAGVAGVDPQTPVWALIFSGAFADPSTCRASPAATPCPSQPDALLVLNYTTGTELGFIVPPPR